MLPGCGLCVGNAKEFEARGASVRRRRAAHEFRFTERSSHMLRRWAVPVLMVLGLGVADASAQETHFRVLAGTSPAGEYDDGTGGDARFNVPTGIAVDSSGTLYVADSQNCRHPQDHAVGAVTTFAGRPGQFGSANGTGSAAQFSVPQAAPSTARATCISPIPSITRSGRSRPAAW